MIMLIIHIGIALFSIGAATLTLVYPSWRKLLISYGLIGLTIASGTYLVITLHTSLLKVCLTGLVYLGIVSAALVGAHYRLAAIRVSSDSR
jgi:prepilin signal peptidase PulO-like enzyme (type II secretory pathway)